METLSIVLMNWRDLRNPLAGGAEVYTHEVLRRFAAWGHDVSLLTSQFPSGAAEETLDGVHIFRAGDRFSVYRKVREAYEAHFGSPPSVLIDEINTRPFHTPRYAAPQTRLFALIHQLAREFWSYETPFPVNLVGRYWLEDRWLREYIAVPTACLSESTRRDLVSLGFHDVTVVPCGMSRRPLDLLPMKESTPTLVYINRLQRAKLPDHALLAFAEVRRQLPQAQLWVIGDGYLRGRLERDAGAGVRFWGHVSETQKTELLTRAHLLLYPAVREGWGISILEANAVGTPALGYDVPGLRDSIRDGETGALVQAGDATALGAKSVEILRDEAMREAMAKRGLAWASQFSWDRTARELLAFLERGKPGGTGQ